MFKPIAVAVLAVALTACSSLTTEPTTYTLSGNCSTKFNAPTVPPPAVHHQIDIGSCDFVPLGHMEFYGEQDINLAAGTQSGQRTFTAANGDVLRGANSGTSAITAPGVVSFSATLTFNGGTGQFAGATGQARIQGTATLATSSATFTIVEGSLRAGIAPN
jgi:hypothetical protein